MRKEIVLADYDVLLSIDSEGRGPASTSCRILMETDLIKYPFYFSLECLCSSSSSRANVIFNARQTVVCLFQMLLARGQHSTMAAGMSPAPR